MVRPDGCRYLNYEGEVAIVIGRPCRGITPEQAGDYIAGTPSRTTNIARTITLLPGDVLLSGTPANSRPVQPGDVVEVEVDGLGRLKNYIVAGPFGIPADFGAQPTASEEVLSTALGGDWEFRGIRPRPGAEARCPPFRPYHRAMPRRFAIGSAQDLVQAERDIRARIGDSELDFAAMAAVSNIYRAANAIRNHMEQKVLAEEDLSWAAFTVLFVLWIWGDQQTRHLAAEAGVTKGTLTGVLKTLEKRGLARRRGHDADGRLVLVSIEPKGQDVIERLFPAFNRGEAQVSAGLDADEKDQLASLLRTIIRTVEEED